MGGPVWACAPVLRWRGPWRAQMAGTQMARAMVQRCEGKTTQATGAGLAWVDCWTYRARPPAYLIRENGPQGRK